MSTSTRFITTVMTVPGLIGLGLGLGAGSASAEAANGGTVPFSAVYRSCDFTHLNFVNAVGTAYGNVTIGTGGTQTVTAHVTMAIGVPNTPYQVRLIQGPRSGSQSCVAGNQGVASAMLNTDGNGVGNVTLTAPRASGATNAWVFVDGPPDPGEIRGEFYTSDMVTSIS
jgi:hypothetical protein